jgi:hypothetical protein
MKTFLALSICEGIGAADACACKMGSNSNIAAIPRKMAATLTFSIVPTFHFESRLWSPIWFTDHNLSIAE